MSYIDRTVAGEPSFAEARRSASRATWTAVRGFVRRSPGAALASAFLIALVVVALVPDALAPQDPTVQAPQNALRSVSGKHPFGTDNFGRDVFSRIVHGARTTLLVGFGAVAVGLAVATLLGSVSAYRGGWVDMLVQRLVDAMMALPWLLILMSMMALIGPGALNTLLVIGLLSAPAASRVIRGSVLTLRQTEFVLAARTIGCPPSRVLWRHILPSITAPLIVLASTGLGAAILAEASLSFLGFGVVPPAPAWGYMIGVEGRRFLTTAPWLAIFPGAAIALVVLTVNVLADALRDQLDPRTGRDHR
jgi:ABC-type dipeptide/oligopeptide/nickel transport system permease subunit